MNHNIATGYSSIYRKNDAALIPSSPEGAKKSGSRKTSIAVVIVNYGTRQALRACIDSIERHAATEVIVVDNASLDGSAELVRREYPWVKLHANTSNYGYGAAANQAIAVCTARYVLLLNADTILQPGALRALEQYLNGHPRVAIVGPRLIDADGTLQASCYSFPTPLHTFLENSACAVTLGRFIRRNLPLIGRLYWRTWAHDSARAVPWVKGAAIAIRCKAFKAIDGFDEAFFMYFEDADLCRRLTATGWEIHFAPVTTITHLGAASASGCVRKIREKLLASTLKYYQKHASARQQLAATMLMNLLLARGLNRKLSVCITFDSKNVDRLRAALPRAKDVYPGATGKCDSLPTVPMKPCE